jgi:hypothetical protein
VPNEGATLSNPTPFQSQKASTANSDLHGLVPGDAGPPFQNSQVLPAGALVTVRLNVLIVSGRGFGESFEAVLDEPVVVDGNTMIPRDAIVSGRIESTHTSRITPGRGYVRLTLESVQVDGLDVPIQTASLFARSLPKAHTDSDTIRLEKGRRMTFRLRDPVFLQLSSSKNSQ